MDIPFLPSLNAGLNTAAAILLWNGRKAIKAGNPRLHRNLMIAALATSAAFLTSYIIYHYTSKITPYPHQDWRKILYLLVLIPHVLLATGMVPFILGAVYFALQGRFAAHRRLVRIVWPVWMYVSVTGVLLYLMLYILR